MDTLPDLRVTIAESMEALAFSGGLHAITMNDDFYSETVRLLDGAQTLRWCAAREAPSIEELQAEIERLEDIIEAVDEAAGPSSLSAAKRLAEIRNLVA